MAPTGHSWFSPSKGVLGVRCPPSIKLTESMEEASSSYASEGTAAHELAEFKGRDALGLEVGKRPTSEFDSDEMEAATDEYAELLEERVNQIKLSCKDPLINFETQVTMGDYVPGSFGTCDFMCVGEPELLIVDFKYGYQEISAIENVQMQMYALGAYLRYNLFYDFTEVTMIICQPRIHNTSVWHTTVDELLDWAENVLKPAAALAAKGEGEFNPGPWCSKYYCKARMKCRARCDELLKIAQMEFKPAPLLSDEELACVMDKADQLSKWSDEIMAYATEQAINQGTEYPGWKLVQGRSVTKLTDEKGAVEDALKAGFKKKQLYRETVITLTAMKKLLGDDKYAEIILPHTTKTEPKLTLARDTDKRQAVSHNAADEFKD